MLVYGDHRELIDPARRVRDIEQRLGWIANAPPGLGRHSKLVSVLIESGQLLQGIADAEFAERSLDRLRPDLDRLGEFLVKLGRAVCRSWDSGFHELGELPGLGLDSELPDEVMVRLPEGFAFYALYPEAYIDAARRLALLAPARVIGIRSIGTTLAAVVAAALGARAAVTVRPFGDPYDRKVALDSELERTLLGGDSHFIIVDEGPGQSGSSFGAVSDWLQERGVPRERIALLPSHSGRPGPQAGVDRRRRWDTVQRQAADFGERWPALLTRWCAEALGAPEAPLRDISGGEWRRLRYAREEDWPATVPAWERRKFLTVVDAEPVLLKFAGLGEIAERKLAIARTLYAEGLVPEPLGLVHGFLAERWCHGAAALAPDEAPVAEIARYIAARSRLLPAPGGGGASLAELLTMARRNISIELGDAALRALDGWKPRLGAMERRMVRVRSDNKLDRQEWLRMRGGALVKTDALDHHEAHDLIGCQSVEWDVAGAMVEFDLGQKAARELVRHVEETGSRADPELLEFSRMAYLAFRLGQARLGAEMSAPEAVRLNRCGDRYAAELQLLLERSRLATRPEPSVG